MTTCALLLRHAWHDDFDAGARSIGLRRVGCLTSMTFSPIGLLFTFARRPWIKTKPRSMSKLTMFSLEAGRLVATPAEPVPVVAGPLTPSVAAGLDAIGSSSTSSASRARVKTEDATLRAFGRRVSPRKPQTGVKYEEASEDEAAELTAARSPPRSAAGRQSSSSKRPFDSSAMASSSKLKDESPASSSRKPQMDAASSPKKARRSPVKGAADGPAFTLAPPPRWREAYDAIKAMRADIVAPVDGMGCAAAGEKEQDPIRSRFAVLISLMLSSQTKGASRTLPACCARSARR